MWVKAAMFISFSEANKAVVASFFCFREVMGLKLFIIIPIFTFSKSI